MKLQIPVSLVLGVTVLSGIVHAGPVHHELKVKVLPQEHRIEAVDRITLPAPASELGMSLDINLASAATAVGEGVRTEPAAAPGRVVLRRGTPADAFAIFYKGTIDYPLAQVGEEYARGQKDTIGSIGPEGVYLDGGSGWYPRLSSEEGLTFDLSVELPPGWDAVSQGTRVEHRVTGAGTSVRWVCDQPQEGIWLVAGRYSEYAESFGRVQAMAFFRQPEEALARKYIEATGEFIAMYEKLIGPYPYGKFALVENFWETGYGMPSFTLLGPRVIRFPFIIESSFPHEILHNWWGNSVFIDYGAGNWGEGLTAYLSDHLLKEQKGLGARHRQETLQKYADYVLSERDLPLTAFRSRHGSVSEAVGYGKTMMLFHMLRLQIGDGLFRKGLQTLYEENRYQTAGFDDVRSAFEKVTGGDLGWFFDQWVSRVGAPVLKLEGLMDKPSGRDRFALSLTLKQLQEGEPYRLAVPVAVTLQGREEAELFSMATQGATASTTLLLDARPVRVDVDPRFDLFRRLDRREIPAALTLAFGARKAAIVLPMGAAPGLLESYRTLAQALARTGPGTVEIVEDTALDALPRDTSVWLLGWENRLLDGILPALSEQGARVDAEGGSVQIAGEPPVDLERGANTVVLAGRHPDNPDLGVLWIGADNPAAHAGLARKLPHYHKYSYLGFSGDAPENVARGRWSVVGSPLTAALGDTSAVPMGELPPRSPLVERPVAFSPDRMMEDIARLASEGMKGRANGSPELGEAASFIARRFEEAGLEPGGGAGSWYQEWVETDGDATMTLKNVIGRIPGVEVSWKEQSVILGAHYDHLGYGGEGALALNRGRTHSGADDNASGVAVLLELARVLAGGPPPRRTLIFVAFAGEEAGKLGSKHYIETPQPYPARRAMGMLNLDTVGRLGDGKLLVLGGGSAEEWVHIFRGAGYVTGVDVQVVSRELDSSDHVCFIEAGVPGVQLFTGAHEDYHRPSDTVDRIDAQGLVKVAAVAREAITYLAGREDPLSSDMTRGRGDTGRRGEKSLRKVSLGTVPDFGYEGEGVRLEGIVAGSPAEKAGMKRGDLITALNGKTVKELRDLSDILKGLGAGDKVEVLLLRDGAPMTVETLLEER